MGYGGEARENTLSRSLHAPRQCEAWRRQDAISNRRLATAADGDGSVRWKDDVLGPRVHSTIDSLRHLGAEVDVAIETAEKIDI